MSGSFQPVFGGAASGGASIVNTNVAFIDPQAGNDITGTIGNPARPYASIQPAYDAGARIFHVGDCEGVGSQMDLTIDQTIGAQHLFFRGVGIENSEVTIINHGVDGLQGLSAENPSINGTAGSAAVALTVESDGTIYITNDVQGGDGGSGGADPEGTGGDGGDAGGVDAQVYIGCVGDLTNIAPGDPGDGGGGLVVGNNGNPVDPATWGHATVIYRRCEINIIPSFQLTVYATGAPSEDAFYGFDTLN